MWRIGPFGAPAHRSARRPDLISYLRQRRVVDGEEVREPCRDTLVGLGNLVDPDRLARQLQDGAPGRLDRRAQEQGPAEAPGPGRAPGTRRRSQGLLPCGSLAWSNDSGWCATLSSARAGAPPVRGKGACSHPLRFGHGHEPSSGPDSSGLRAQRKEGLHAAPDHVRHLSRESQERNETLASRRFAPAMPTRAPGSTAPGRRRHANRCCATCSTLSHASTDRKAGSR